MADEVKQLLKEHESIMKRDEIVTFFIQQNHTSFNATYNRICHVIRLLEKNGEVKREYIRDSRGGSYDNYTLVRLL